MNITIPELHALTKEAATEAVIKFATRVGTWMSSDLAEVAWVQHCCECDKPYDRLPFLVRVINEAARTDGLIPGEVSDE